MSSSTYKKSIDLDDDESPMPPRKPRSESSVTPNQQKSEYDLKKSRAPLSSEPIGGPVTANYSEFIQKLYSPANHTGLSASALADYSDMAYSKEIPASLQLKVELMEAAAELRSKGGGGESKLFSPMDSMCDLYSKHSLEDKPYAKYDVYQPKSNAEWYSLANRRPLGTDTPSVGIHYKTAKTAASPNQWNYKPAYDSKTSRINSGEESRRYSATQSNPKHYVIDYSNFRSAPLSPYMYRGHEYVKRHDSRIVGSDFVMLTLRPRDDFLNKIDRTLAEARKINSWST